MKTLSIVSDSFGFSVTKIVKMLALSISLLVFSESSYALRCGNKLVEINDRKHHVLHKCGEPTYTDSFEQASPHNPYLIRKVDVWTYNFGSSKFMQELLFRNGRLYRINDLGYGY